jgi:HAD superfamily hydrolase (TIGR01509 family)
MNKLVIFDFDGTIVDSMWAWDALGRETLEENLLVPLPDYEKVIRTMSVPDFSRFLAEEYPSLAPAEELMEKWHKKMVYNYLNRVRLKDGIVEFLEYLKKSGVTVYLASATHYDILIQAVKHFGLEKYFDYILTEERVGVSKREPKIYLMCAQRAECKLENIYLFEDASHAVKTAKSIGVNVCALSDYSMRECVDEIRSVADMYIDDFTDIESLKKFIEN